MSINFKLNDNEGFGSDMCCVLEWQTTPPSDQIDAAKKLINGWFQVGMYGLFEGDPHFLDDIKVEGLKMAWMVDTGSADSEKAYGALKTIFEGFNDTSSDIPGWVKIKSLVAGE